MIAELSHHYGQEHVDRLPARSGPPQSVPDPLVIAEPTIFRALGLTADPFAPALPPVFADTASHRSVVDILARWLLSDAAPGIGFLTADPGCGTTTVLDTLVRYLASQRVAPIRVTPGEGRLTDIRLLRRTVIALDGTPDGRTGLALANQCRRLLDALQEAGQHPVLMLDGFDLGGSQIEIVQSLMRPPENQADPASELSIIFTGSAAFAQRLLRRPAMRSHLRCHIRLERLDLAGTATLLNAYIDPVRLRTGETTPLLTEEAIGIIVGWAQGEARAILRLAREAMLEAIATGRTVVDASVARQIAREFTHEAQLARRASDAARYPGRVQAALAFADPPGEQKPGEPRAGRNP